MIKGPSFIDIRPFARVDGRGPFRWTSTGFIVETNSAQMQALLAREAENYERMTQEVLNTPLYPDAR